MIKKETRDTGKALRFMICILIALGILVCAEICVNKFFGALYSSFSEEEKGLITGLVRMKEVNDKNPHAIFSSKYNPFDEPFIVVWTYKGTRLPKKIFAFNIKNSNAAYYAKRVTTQYGEKEIGDIYTLSRFTPGGAELLSPDKSGRVEISGQSIRYYRYEGDLFKSSSESLDYFFNRFAYESFIDSIQRDWKEPKESVRAENTQEYYRLLALEYAILDEMIPYSEAERTQTLIRHFVSVREARKRLFPSAAYQEQMELRLGCANFSAIKLSVWTKRDYAYLSDILPGQERSFSKILSMCAEGSLKKELLEETMYRESGAVLIGILERLKMEFKEELISAKGEKTPYALLKRIDGNKQTEKPRDIEELFERYLIDEDAVKKLAK